MDQVTRPALRDSMRSVLLTFAVAWLWVSAMVVLFGGILGMYSESVTGRLLSVAPDWFTYIHGVTPWMNAHRGLSVVGMLFIAPPFEEALYRVLPLSYALVKEASLIEAGHKRRGKQFVVAVTVIVCGVIFGAVHGRMINILLQGVVGWLCARLYLRNYQFSQLRAYGMCVSVHFLYNFAVLATAFTG
jgi:predicted lysophospholipase L1 biosynthesis ABC-type transport system permease subunit